MGVPTEVHDAEFYLRHAGWLRKLARGLIAGEEEAGDLVQETWLVALQHPPRNTESMRGWLATVLRRLHVRSRRDAERRSRREARTSKDATSVATSDIVERLSTQRLLARLVAELPREQREVVYLHYYDTLTLSRIAARLDVPLGTVKTRLHRALEHLRARLRGELGADETWKCALLPIASGVLGISTKSVGVAGAAAVVLVGASALVVHLVGLCATVEEERVSRAPAPELPPAFVERREVVRPSLQPTAAVVFRAQSEVGIVGEPPDSMVRTACGVGAAGERSGRKDPSILRSVPSHRERREFRGERPPVLLARGDALGSVARGVLETNRFPPSPLLSAGKRLSRPRLG